VPRLLHQSLLDIGVTAVSHGFHGHGHGHGRDRYYVFGKFRDRDRDRDQSSVTVSHGHFECMTFHIKKPKKSHCNIFSKIQNRLNREYFYRISMKII